MSAWDTADSRPLIICRSSTPEHITKIKGLKDGRHVVCGSASSMIKILAIPKKGTKLITKITDKKLFEFRQNS